MADTWVTEVREGWCWVRPEQLITLDKDFYTSSFLIATLCNVWWCCQRRPCAGIIFEGNCESIYDLNQSCWWIRPTQLITLDKDFPHNRRTADFRIFTPFTTCFNVWWCCDRGCQYLSWFCLSWFTLYRIKGKIKKSKDYFFCFLIFFSQECNNWTYMWSIHKRPVLNGFGLIGGINIFP